MTGVSSDTLKSSLQKLNSSMGNIKNGTGTFSKYLTENNKALLASLQSANGTEDAFTLLLDAINKAPDEFPRAQLAQEAFGKSGQQLILMADAGTDGIKALREEAEHYGIISNQAAKQSEEYLDAQARLKASLEGVRNELSSALMPAMTDGLTGVAEFIAGIDDWEGKLKIAGVALAAAAAALATFVTVSKGAEAVQKMSLAIKAMTTAIAGPAGAAALAVTALAAGIGAIVVMSEKQAHAGEALAVNLADTKSKADGLIDSYATLNPGKALDEETTRNLISLYPELNGHLEANATTTDAAAAAIRALNEQKAMDASSQWLEKLKKEQAYIDGVSESVKNAVANNETWTGSRAAQLGRYKGALKDAENYRDQANAILATIGKQLGNNNEVVDYVDSAALVAKIKKDAADAAAAEEARIRRIETAQKAANDSLMIQTKKYTESLEELHLKNDEIENDEKQLLELQLAREIASINASDADIKTKNSAIAAAKELYAEQIKLSEINFAEEQAKKAKAAKAKEIADAKAAAEEQKKIANDLKSHLTALLSSVPQTEKQIQEEQIAQFQQFLKARTDAEGKKGEERIAYVQEQRELLLNQMKLEEDEKQALIKASDDAILAEKQRFEAAKAAIMQAGIINSLNAISGFAELSLQVQKNNLVKEIANLEAKYAVELGSESTTAERKKEIEADLQSARQRLIDEANRRAQSAAIAQKSLSVAEATVQTYLAASKAFAQGGGFPWGAVNLAATIAMGIANVGKIIATPIPKMSAETGGSFMADYNSPRVDGGLLRVNRNERVDITPAGQTGNEGPQTFNLVFDGQILAQAINRLARRGELHTLRLADNL
ncbi:hypothetical protein [Leadbettera azotonutricia]|uniref:hypothetical protein n=1 Tax=Leadbettera azotonutricia TaxID=150829 RepID=UPI0011D1A898|nr:hypothetical protein [Leadbettera azotonutricia]